MAQTRLLWPIENLGRWLREHLEVLGGQWGLVGRATAASVHVTPSQRQYIGRVTAMQVYFSGCQALPLVGWLAIAVGSVIVFYTSSDTSAFNSSEVSVRLLYLIAVKEVGPLLSALVLIARSGTAVASELGAMKVSAELDALRAVGVNPLAFVVFPRVFAGILSQVGLVLFFSTIALVGGFWTASFRQPMTVPFFVLSLCDQVNGVDFVFLALKAVGTGATIFASACFFGLRVERSSHEIPQATTRAVVAGIAGALAWSVMLSIVQLNGMSKGRL